MREILFRAKAINRVDGREYRTNYKNGDWVYGIVSRLYDERFENLPAEMTNTNGVGGIDVDYKTVGQFTGLTDKNGKMIFEGDIIEFDCDNLGVIEWDEDCAKFSIRYDEDIFTDFDSYWGDDCEVVGNIYNNSELLMNT